MAFSALLSCDTPTIALRMRIVRIWPNQCMVFSVPDRGATYNDRIDKGCPVSIFFKEGEDEGDRGRG